MKNVDISTLTLRHEVQVKQCDGNMTKGVVKGIYDNGKNKDGTDNIGINVEYDSKATSTFIPGDVFEIDK